jgi:hypothetical protein
MAYTSYEKRYGRWYDVIDNDQYALATTIYCMLTKENPPASDTWMGDKRQWLIVHENALEHLHAVLSRQWDSDNITYIHDTLIRLWGMD